MSRNQSPQVVPTPPPDATPPDDRPAASRTPFHRDSHSPSAQHAPAHITPPAASPMPQPPPEEPQHAKASHPRSGSPSPAPDPRPAKRMRLSRRPADDESSHPRSSPSPSLASSQDDDGREAGIGSSAEYPTSSTAADAPRKKRTRTLTTPQQSAELHALLAESRFPTTAMREDVGRRIGLSPRKVQVWFQNQRQKAKRPKGESETPLTRLPQYGPFPSAPPSAYPQEPPTAGPPPHSSHFAEGSSGSGLPTSSMGYDPRAMSRPAAPDPRQHSRRRPPFGHEVNPSFPPSTGMQLVGPGVPGPGGGFSTFALQPVPAAVQPRASGLPMAMAMAHAGPAAFHGEYPYRGTGALAEEPAYTHGVPRPAPSAPRARYGPPPPLRGPEPPIVLPPLQPPSAPYPGHRREQYTPSPQGIPPPFALQPAPQWARPQAASAARRGSGSGLYAEPAPGAGPSRLSDVRYAPDYQSRSQTPPTARTGRFDPVRASSSEETPTGTRRHSRTPGKDTA